MNTYRIFAFIFLQSFPLQAADLVLPALNYRPETDWAFGALYLKTMRFRDEPESSRPTSFRVATLFSLKGFWNVQFFPELFWDDEKYRLNGDIGYLNVPDRYFGLGANTDPSIYSTFNTSFARLRLNLRRQWEKKYGFGPVLEFEQRVNQWITPVDVVGANGSRTLGLGFIASLDTRDGLFYPTQGEYLEFSSVFFSPIWLSQFSYSRYRLDLRKFYSILSPENVIAIQYWMQGVLGDVPFTALSILGGSRISRGYWEGRIRDRIAWAAQAEYRRIVWKQIGVAGFISVGSAGSTLEQAIQRFLPSAGFGVRYRFDEKDHINARLDFAWGVDSFGFYLMLGEAF